MHTTSSQGGDSSAAQEVLRVVVLAGGPSAEREISLQSGQAIADALRHRGHHVTLADISPDDLGALDLEADAVFPALHGTFGEDGTLQRIMEQRGVCFVGSGSAASATAMDKVQTKKLAEQLSIPTPEYEIIDAGCEPSFAAPVVVKPIAQGSSVGTTVIKDQSKVASTVAAVAGEFGQALVEQFVAGDEITVGFLGEQPLPPICIRPKREFYDYEAKYRDDHTEYLFDAGIDPDVLARAQQESARVYKALNCRHLGRIDWIVDSAGDLWFLEVNTIPGFTSHSLVPKAAAQIGLPFDELVERLVRMAMEDHS